MVAPHALSVITNIGLYILPSSFFPRYRKAPDCEWEHPHEHGQLISSMGVWKSLALKIMREYVHRTNGAVCSDSPSAVIFDYIDSYVLFYWY